MTHMYSYYLNVMYAVFMLCFNVLMYINYFNGLIQVLPLQTTHPRVRKFPYLLPFRIQNITFIS